MANITVQPPLSNVQAELLKLFSANIPDNQLLELKKVMANFLLNQARDRADVAWDAKGYTDETLNTRLTND